jgi:hypothetical protein
MIKLIYSLHHQFSRWFFECEQCEGKTPDKMFLLKEKGERDYWMEEAYRAGAKAAMNETLCILGDWAAACEGLEPELVVPSEIYDRAAMNLEHYYDEIKARR